MNKNEAAAIIVAAFFVKSNNKRIMKTVKAKQTLHGSYGLKSAGDTFSVPDSIADKLVAGDLVELVEENQPDTKTAEQQQEETTVAKNKEIDQKAATKRAEKSK